MSDAREGARFFYQQVAPVDRQAHAVDRYLSLVESLGVPITRPLRFPLPTRRYPSCASTTMSLLFSSIRSPAAAQVTQRSRGRRILPRLGAAPRSCSSVGPSAKFRSPDNCVESAQPHHAFSNSSGSCAARFTISVDSGPMHIASAFSERLVSIHTWTDPRKVGPYNENAWVWKNGELPRVRDLPVTSWKVKGRAFRTSRYPRELLSR